MLFPVLAGAQTAANPPWASSISSIEATNIVRSTTADTLGIDDLVRSLTNAPVEASTNYLSELPRITDLVPAEGSADNADEMAERVRVTRAIREADAYYKAGQWLDAVSHMTDTLAQTRFPMARAQIYNRIGFWYFRKHDLTNAIVNLRAAKDTGHLDSMSACNLAAALLTDGQVAEADRIISMINVVTIRDPVLMYSVFFNAACAKSLLGKHDQALFLLARAAQADPVSTLVSLPDPQLDPIRADPRFHSLREALEKYHIARTTEPKPEDE